MTIKQSFKTHLSPSSPLTNQNLSPVTITFFLLAILLGCYDRNCHRFIIRGSNIPNKNPRIVYAGCCLLLAQSWKEVTHQIRMDHTAICCMGVHPSTAPIIIHLNQHWKKWRGKNHQKRTHEFVFHHLAPQDSFGKRTGENENCLMQQNVIQATCAETEKRASAPHSQIKGLGGRLMSGQLKWIKNNLPSISKNCWGSPWMDI